MWHPGRLQALGAIAFATTWIGTAVFAANDACGTRYELLELGALVPSGASSARALNDRGQVTGSSTIGIGQTSAFLWSCRDGMQDIGQATQAPDTYGTAINELAQIVIYASAQWPEINPTVYVWDHRGATLLDPSRSFFPHTITNTGIVTDGNQLWTRRGGLRTLNIGVRSFDARLTNFGRLSGVILDANDRADRLFTWTRQGGVRDLGPTPTDHVQTDDINDRGDLMVHAYGDLRTTFIVDRRGRLTFLPKPPDAFTVNGRHLNLSREVIGDILTQVGNPPRITGGWSFLWDARRGYRNLDELLFGTPTSPRFNPSDLNNWGWIAGNSENGAAIAIPVPANDPRFEDLGELEGESLCRALNLAKLYRFVCSLTDR